MYDGAFFVVEKGVLNDSYNGTINYDGKEFYVENGQLTGEVVSEFELNWADFESILIENEIDGNFYTLNAVTAQFWAPSIFEQVELTDEDAHNGLICYFHDGNKDTYGFFVTYVDGKGATLEKLAGEIGKDKAYTDLEKLKINGLDAIAYSEVDDELKVTFQHVSFLTDNGYFMTFSYWDTADEDYMSLVVCMVASIQPE